MTITEQRFLKDVAEHKMTVHRDDGVHRHLRFQKPGTGVMHFEIVTWPGYLAYTGDMGCYVFTRLQDMFQFFRADRTERTMAAEDRRTVYINPSYWSEKVAAEDRHSAVTAFSSEKFTAAVRRWLDEQEATPEQRRAVEQEVLPHVHDCEYDAMRAATEFQHHDGFRLHDFWEASVRDYTFRFLWCCYALAWAVQQYDDDKAINREADSTEKT